MTRSSTLNSIILPKENLQNFDNAISNSLSDHSLIYDSSSVSNCQIRNLDSTNLSMTLNNAISDLVFFYLIYFFINLNINKISLNCIINF